jgi:hypothetical protein
LCSKMLYAMDRGDRGVIDSPSHLIRETDS